MFAVSCTFGGYNGTAPTDLNSGDDDDLFDDDDAADDDDSSADDDDDSADDDDSSSDDDDDDDDTTWDDCNSPVEGSWVGTFDGAVDSSLTGPQVVEGVVAFDILCKDRLVISGVMSGSENIGVPFEAILEGEYAQSTDELVATMTGFIGSTLAFSGDFTGALVSETPYTLDGLWDGTAPAVLGVGSGTWTAELQP
jgi:hypothetical protein